jgi:hypothetical protein
MKGETPKPFPWVRKSETIERPFVEQTFPIDSRRAPATLESKRAAPVVAVPRAPAPRATGGLSLVSIPSNGGSIQLAPALVPYVQRLRSFARASGATFHITSGYRSPDEQRRLHMRWEAGDPTIIAEPVTNSLHLLGLAVDIESSSLSNLGRFAETLGMRWGGRFGDPVHFDLGRR